jgi:hypothetical protein
VVLTASLLRRRVTAKYPGPAIDFGCVGEVQDVTPRLARDSQHLRHELLRSSSPC